MVKTVVVLQTVVVGSVSILLALTSRPPVRGQDTVAVSIPQADARANALKALKEAQSKIDCTFALQMKEVDPDADPKIHAPVVQQGDARIRRILPPACLMRQVRGPSGKPRTVGQPK